MSDLTGRMKRRVKHQLSGEKPTVWIGKNQTSKELLKEIEKQLDKREMVKVKILRNALERDKAKEIAAIIAKETESSLVEIRGHTFMLYKRRRK